MSRFVSEKSENLIIKFLVIVVSYFLIKNLIKKGAKAATQDAILSGDVNALIAVEMRQAMNPTGTQWFMDFDGTDVQALFNSARKTKDFAAVARAYANLYDADLLTDLQNELSADDFKKLQSLIGKGNATGKFYAKTTAPAYVIKDGKIFLNEIFETYKAGELIASASDGYTEAQDGTIYYLFTVEKWFGLGSQSIAINEKLIAIQ